MSSIQEIIGLIKKYKAFSGSEFDLDIQDLVNSGLGFNTKKFRGPAYSDSMWRFMNDYDKVVLPFKKSVPNPSIEDINNILSAAQPAKKDMIVWRGIRKPIPSNLDNFSNQTFMSTSLDEAVAKEYSKHPPSDTPIYSSPAKRGSVLTIHIPAGMPVIPSGVVGDYGSIMDAHHVIIPPSARFARVSGGGGNLFTMTRPSLIKKYNGPIQKQTGIGYLAGALPLAPMSLLNRYQGDQQQ